jgi:valyl-tRNA synthetase
MLEKTFNPAEIEPRLYRMWEEQGAFRAGLRPNVKPFSIVIPPPNVTGSLHMGHALNNTIQDILVRFERMKGKDVLWQPGTDHAGIATQMVVERLLQQENRTDRRSMGREAFVRRVWEWKEHSGGLITQQLRRLGASCDWSRERFTMDEGLSRAVIRVFVQLYKEGLIYKDRRLVNWDPKLLTAISDLEVQQVETKGSLWYFDYPLAEDPSQKITVATTRPETMLGDTAVAVHPDDERYQSFIGKELVLPLVGRRIPVIADEFTDPEKGTGAVKITPAHDFHDFEVGKRQDLPSINIFDQFAKLTLAGNADFAAGAEVPAETLALHGLDRFEARKRIVAMMQEKGLCAKFESHVHQLPHGDRSGVVIEPWLTMQCYVDAATLARPAIAAVERGETVFVPPQWEKTYFEWMRNIQPWCISRQLWWGHQIPAWYGPNGEVFVEESQELAEAAALRHYGKAVALSRDEDVLDTWFSSALWPFSTLGWPAQTPELKRYYPTDVLVTGFDIIFFWVARMMMMGLHLTKDREGHPQPPFHTVYIHALVRDEKGQKMSKSKGNVMDPLDLIETYGADALRFTLAAMAAQGRDIKLSTQRVEGYRNFATKLWNAARFAEMNQCLLARDFDPVALRLSVNRWIAGEVARTRDLITKAIEEHRYNEAAGAAYHFVWHVFCDWYLELIKPVLAEGSEDARSETRAATAWALDQVLLLLHPFMPFITEELWQKTQEQGTSRQTPLILAPWPSYRGLGDANADAELKWTIDFISEVRSVRAEMNVPAGAKIPAVVVGANAESRRRASTWMAEITRLARLEAIGFADRVPPGSAQIVLGEAIIALPLGGIVDLQAEKGRLEREMAKIGADVDQIAGRLANEGFVAKAPGHVLEEARERKQQLEARRQRIADALRRFSQAS